MTQKIPDTETKQNHNHQCACGCSAAYDQIDDKQFEKAFQLNILPKKYFVIAAVIISVLTTALYFLI
jgi:hypothetical protein